jgi:LysM domain
LQQIKTGYIMKKLFVLFSISIAFFHSANAQAEDLFVKKGSSGLYIDHKVTPRQGLYAVGRLYNVNPKFIAQYNKIGLNDGLNLGQTLHIPLTDTNFTQTGYSGTPVYYRVGTNESLQKVSQANNDVSTQLLKDWNNLVTNTPRSGVKLIIGFLNSAELPSITIAPPVKKEEPEKPKTADKPSVKTEDVAKNVVKDEPKKEEPKPIVKEEPKAIVKQEPPKGEIKPPVVKEEPKKEVTPPPVVVKEDPKKNNVIADQEGFFKSYFDDQVKGNPVSENPTVTSGIFKTTSGWQDAKYYMLIDGIMPGTIVKITNPGNNKTVYAKVLGEMTGILQNEGLDIRISNAAAFVLQMGDEDKFIVKLSY